MTHRTTPILFVANNPGGFRALAPVMHAFASESRLWIAPSLLTLGEHPRTADIHELAPDHTFDDLRRTLKNFSPRVLITGTSVPNSPGGALENQLRLLARELHIPSLSIIDHWCNYAARFSTNGTACDALADYICVMDTRAQHEAIADGLPAATLHITGHPGFDALLAMTGDERRTLRAACRTAWKVRDTDRVIGFISEPLREDYGNARGYDQFHAWEWLCAALTQIHQRSPAKPEAVAPPLTTFVMRKLHPRESSAAWTSAATPSRLIDGRHTHPHAAVLACDLVIGMTSILLFEAALLGQPTWSVQPHAAASTPWHRIMHAFPVMTTQPEFHTRLYEWLRTDAPARAAPNFYTQTRATHNVVQLIRTILCRCV